MYEMPNYRQLKMWDNFPLQKYSTFSNTSYTFEWYFYFYQERPKLPKEMYRILETLEKTAVIPIGGNYNTNDRLCPELTLSWEDKFTLLGFQIDNRLRLLNDNYEKCFKKVHEIGRKWARYRLSLKGLNSPTWPQYWIRAPTPTK